TALHDNVGPPVLPRVRRLDLAARELRNELHAVADPEDGHAEVEDLGVSGGGAGVGHGARSTREDDPFRLKLAYEGQVGTTGGRVNLAVDVRLADPPRDELGELRAVVEDEDPVHALYHVVGSAVSPRSRSSRVSRGRDTK